MCLRLIASFYGQPNVLEVWPIPFKVIRLGCKGFWETFKFVMSKSYQRFQSLAHFQRWKYMLLKNIVEISALINRPAHSKGIYKLQVTENYGPASKEQDNEADSGPALILGIKRIQCHPPGLKDPSTTTDMQMSRKQNVRIQV